MPKLRGKIRYMNPGDLVVVGSPYRFVTHDGQIRSRINPTPDSVTGHVKMQDDWQPLDIPYETRAILIDEKIPLIMLDGKIVMLPRICLKRCSDE